MKDQDTYKPLLEALREAPTEMSMEDVNRMVVGFPLLPTPFDWTSILSLKSIIMTSISALFIAGAFSLLSGEEKQGSLEIKKYQEQLSTELPTDTPEQAFLDPQKDTVVNTPLLASEPETNAPMPSPQSDPEVQGNQSGPNPVQDPEVPVAPEAPVLPVPTVDLSSDDEQDHRDTYINGYEKSFDLKDFTKIGLQSSADVNIHQGSSFSVSAHGDEKMIELLDLYVKNGQLSINTKNNKNNWNNCNSKGLTIEVTMPTIDVVSLAGSGNIHIDGFRALDDLMLSLAGSGNIHGNDDVNIASDLDASIAGSGDIVWSGSVNSLSVSIAGSGDFQASDLRTKNASVSISGSGDVSLQCEDELKVSIAGSGDVNYSGNAHVKKSVIGSGEVNRR